MKYLVSIVLLFFFQLSSAQSSKIEELPNKIDAASKLYGLSQLWSETKYNFINIDQLDYDWDSMYRAYIPLVLNSSNDYEYYQLLKKFMACLKDGHSEVSSARLFHSYMDYMPLLMNDFDKKVYVTLVSKSAETDSSWLGAEVIEISGVKTLNYLTDSIFPYISASTEQHLWMQGTYQLHSDLKWKPFYAKLKKLNGEILSIKLERNGESTKTKVLKTYGKFPKYSRKTIDLTFTEDSMAILTINKFSKPENTIEELYKVMKKVKKAKGLVVDLRRNGGGSTTVANYLQSYFTQGNYFLNFGSETRINEGARKANGNWIKEYEDHYLNKAIKVIQPDTIFVPDSIERVTIPAAILISRFTFSAAEDFLVNLYEVSNRPILIGEATGGSTGSPLVIPDLPGGGIARVCTRRICFPYSMKRFVNEGIKPDIEVKQTLKDYMEDKDVVLEKAIEVIGQKN